MSERRFWIVASIGGLGLVLVMLWRIEFDFARSPAAVETALIGTLFFGYLLWKNIRKRD